MPGRSTLDVSAEFPASISAYSLLTNRQSYEIGPKVRTEDPIHMQGSDPGFEQRSTKVKGMDRNNLNLF